MAVRYASPSELSLMAALAVLAGFFLLVSGGTWVFYGFFPWLLLLTAGLLLFVITWWLFRFFINRFIYDRIKLVYKTIHDLKAPPGRHREMIRGSDDIIARTEADVLAWASDKKKEIEELRKMEAYRREFLGNVSHELKTPVFMIQGYVLTLLDGGLEDPSVNRNYLLRTEQGINRMISIIEDLESISRLESGELRLSYSHFDMISLAAEVMDMLEMKALEKKIRLHFGADYTDAVLVYADRSAIQQVMTNLLVNSIKYGREGGRTKISFFDMDAHYLIEVTDSGVGIGKDELSRVFERFFRGDRSRSRNGEKGGSGLGLAIVKHLVEAHGQSIHVRSTEGVGTTFAFTLRKGKNLSGQKKMMLLI